MEVASEFSARHGLKVAALAEFAGVLDHKRTVISGFPAEWVERYFANHYDHSDAVVRNLRRDPKNAVRWKELRTTVERRSISSRILSEGAEFGLVEGVTIPVPGDDGYLAGVSFAGERMNDDPQLLSALKLVAVYAHARVSALTADPPEAVALTLREIEALRWAAAGRTDQQIAEEMGIRATTVHRHIQNAKEKLGASSRTEAVMTAVRQRLLYVD